MLRRTIPVQQLFSCTAIDLAAASAARMKKPSSSGKIAAKARTVAVTAAPASSSSSKKATPLPPMKKFATSAPSSSSSAARSSSKKANAPLAKSTAPAASASASAAASAAAAKEPALNKEQQDVLNYVVKNPKKSVFLTGGAGTGKSVLIRAIANALPSEHTFITAPTGVAALNIGGITLHSFLRLQPDGQFDLRAMMTGNVWADIQRRFWSCNTLVIDEISMVDPSVFQVVDRLAQLTRKSAEPFGGMQLVLCGDFLQLPPVTRFRDDAAAQKDDAEDNDGEDDGSSDAAASSSSSNGNNNGNNAFRKPRWVYRPPPNRCNADTTSKYCFQTAEWRRLNPRVFELKKVMRQKEPELIALLNNVRFGIHTPDQIQQILLPADRATAQHSAGDVDAPVGIFCRNREVNERNTACFHTIRKSKALQAVHYDAALATPDIPLRREVVYFCAMQGNAGIFGKVIPKRLRLCVGTRVMLLRNLDVARGLVNGSTGIVVGFRDQSVGDAETMDQDHVSETAMFNNDSFENKNNNKKKTDSDNKNPYDAQMNENFKMMHREFPADTLKPITECYPVVKFNGVAEPQVVRPCVWKQKSGGSVASKLMQLPLRHAWAITSHKAQGMTFEKVHVDLSCAFEHGQAYVALSRARTIKHLRLTGYDAPSQSSSSSSSQSGSIKSCPIAGEFHKGGMPSVGAEGKGSKKK